MLLAWLVFPMAKDILAITTMNPCYPPLSPMKTTDSQNFQNFTEYNLFKNPRLKLHEKSLYENIWKYARKGYMRMRYHKLPLDILRQQSTMRISFK